MKIIHCLNMFMFWGIMQEDGHDWYHLTDKDRKEFFCKYKYYMFSFFEKINILDTIRHKVHHEHDANHLDEVKSFDDFRIPFFDICADYIWKVSLNLHKKTKYTMYIITKTISIPFMIFVNGILFYMINKI